MRPFTPVLAFLLLLFPVFAWVYPHQTTYSADPYERILLCATVYAESNASISLLCGNEVVGEGNLAPDHPHILCYNYAPGESTSCTWIQESNRAEGRIDVFPHSLFDAVLSVLLVALIIRFSVRLLKLYARD